MSLKKHYKMYKSGKLWCTMALTGVMMGLSLGTVSGHADTVNSNNANANTALLVQKPQVDKDNVVNNSAQPQSQNDKGANLSVNSDPKINTSVEANSSERPAGNATLPKSASTPQNEVASNKSDPANNQSQTGWQKNEKGQDIYYQNGSVSQGRNYVELPTIPNTNVKNIQSWYLMENGIALSGAQQWQGSMYYFDPITHLRVDNNYVVPAGQKVGYLLGQDGRALSGVQKWQGTYYYFDPATYKLLDHQDYVQSQWGLWYMVGSNGALMTGPVNWQGATYYFDPVTYLRVNNNYVVPAGQRVGYLLGNDGCALSGVQKWQGTYYYFDPTTDKLLDHQDYVQSQWGLWYMVGSNGAVMSGPVSWQGSLYYFDPSSYLKRTNCYVAAYGNLYRADANGILSQQEVANAVNRYILANNFGHSQIEYNKYVIPADITGAYNTANGRPNMVVVHETANPNDSIDGEINYEQATYENAFVHAFVDNNRIVMISTPDHEAWGAGPAANARAVQFEQVEVYGRDNFASELANAAYFAATMMKWYGLTPSLAQPDGSGTLWSHHNVTQYLGYTNHTDPDGYWSNRAWSYFGTGYGMNDFLQLVQVYFSMS